MTGQLKLIFVMLLFGSIGIFVKNIQLSSSEIALLRGAIGSVFLILSSYLMKQKSSFKAVKNNLVLLILSGAALGFNWIFLFEAYRFTTIANATISYYFAPVFVMILAPVVLKEKLSSVKVVSILMAMLGLFFITYNGGSGLMIYDYHSLGIVSGLIAAALYASVILMNKFIKNLAGFETTLFQLMMASLILLPYVYIKEGLDFSGLDSQSVLFIFILGIVHTGFAYFLYFGAIRVLKGQTIAVLSYIDPIFAVVLAAIILRETMSVFQMMGGLLILGSTFLSEKLGNKQA